MANISELGLSCVLQYEINLSWDVISAHLNPSEVPVSLGGVIESLMFHRVVSASGVAKPHIEASICQYECDHLIFRVNHKILSCC